MEKFLVTRNIQAIYENGVLRLLEPVPLAEKQRVTLSLVQEPQSIVDDLLDHEFLAACVPEADPNITLEAVRTALAKIPGSLTEDFISERNER